MPITEQERGRLIEMVEHRTNCVFQFCQQPSETNLDNIAAATKALRTYLDSITERDSSNAR